MLLLDGELQGKPGDPDTARRRWRAMAGRTGELVTGHAVLRMADGEINQVAEGHAVTAVRFAQPSDAELEAYLATGEPLAVAGAFTLDGLGGWFVEGIDGDPSNVIGISLPLLRRLLAAVGVSVTDLWRARLVVDRMTDPKLAEYAHPERLVTTEWLAEHLGDEGLVVVESDEDVLLYDTGHIPGAVKVDWHTELNDPVTRDYVDGARFAEICGERGIGRDTTVVFYGDKQQLVGHLRAVGVLPVRPPGRAASSTAAGPSGSPRAAR